jgi:Fe2+ transport system protein B
MNNPIVAAVSVVIAAAAGAGLALIVRRISRTRYERAPHPAQQWVQLFERLRGESEDLLRDELIVWLSTVKDETDEFVRRQAEVTEQCLVRFAAGLITRQQAESCIKEVRNRTAQQELMVSAAAKASAQRLVDGIDDLILHKLFSKQRAAR